MLCSQQVADLLLSSQIIYLTKVWRRGIIALVMVNAHVFLDLRTTAEALTACRMSRLMDASNFRVGTLSSSARLFLSVIPSSTGADL